MKKYLLLSLLVLSATIICAQEFSFQAGKSISTFQYTDSQGNELQNLQSTDNFFMTLEYRQAILKKVFRENLFTDLGLGYNRYGSTGSDPTTGTFFAWDVTYLGINLGLSYEFFRPGNFTFYAKGTASPEFFLRGEQTLNDQVYDLSGEENFDQPIYFFRGGIGTQLKLSDRSSVYVQYMGGKSFNFNDDPAQLNIVAHNVGFGLLINLSRQETHKIDPVSEQRIEELEKTVNVYSEKIEVLEVQTQRVEALEEEVVAKDVEMEILKDTISTSLFEFDGRGLLVDQRQGKVYVTMATDMLFESGSWVIGKEGEEAVEALGKALVKNPDISILIEGHTDNQPYRGNGNIQDNWDLSIKRATAVVEILKRNPDIDPKNLTAAGRGEYDPVASNDTEEGRAKNRRIEVIITPKLDEVIEILKDKE